MQSRTGDSVSEHSHGAMTAEVHPWASETMSITVTVFVAVITVLVVLFFGIWKYKWKVPPSQNEAPKRYRFRKRDKVMFFGRKMLRKVKSFTRNTVGPSSSGGLRRKPSHKLMISRLRRFLAHRKDPSKPRLKQQSPPQSFLEADWSDINDDHRLPPEVLYMLRSIRVFGHLEKPFFLELCRYMETITLRAGHFLFKVGDPDDSIYVVQDGLLEVYITDVDGTEHLIKQVATGSSIHSLLSILDVLTGHPGAFKSVSARAVEDSTILRLPAHAFKSMFEKFNESTVKVVQIIMIRLQRVTFSALHNYLGLSKELLKPEGHSEGKELHIHRVTRSSISSPGLGSPVRPTPNQSGTMGGETIKEEMDGKTVGGAPGGTPHKRPMVAKPLGESGFQLSDFDAALMRARASISDDKSIVLSGSPPRKVTVIESGGGEASPSSSYRSRTIPDEDIILSLASKDLVQILGLKDANLLDNKLSLSYVRAGCIFCKQGDQDTSLFFLVKGTVSVLQNVVGETAKEALMFHAEPGEIIDVLAVLTGEPSFFTMRAKTDVIMAVISKPDFYQIMRAEPFVVLNVAHCCVKRMSPFVRQIDFALDWQMLEAGKALFRQGDASDSIFIVLTGRLRSVITLVGGKKELVNEFGRGELVGIVEVLTQHERATTVLAIRDTELAKIPAELLNLIKLRYPQVVARLIHLLGTSILGNLQQRNTMSLQTSISRESDAYSKMERTTVANLATIAIVPVTEDVPTTNFALELQHALLTIGPTVRLTPEIVKARLGPSALDSVNEFCLFNWLSQQEDIHRMCLYQCDYQLTKWSKHCLRQADCILIVGLADKEPTIGPIEKELESIAVRAQKELILLHKEDAETPKNTAEWLNARGWLSSHHHLRCPKRVLRLKSPAKTLEIYERLFKSDPDRMADFSRLARFLTGTSIGLVLGGGGARGLAHVGMIRAMQEEGIPIDMVGGTSMGSFIGALWAEERNYVRFTQRAREWSIGMTSLWKKIWDLTYPVASMFTGWAFNESIETVFHDRQIEDLWIPYFCITTNISNSSMRVHSLGSVWRYVRASMSLSGYLPPLCDPVDGHLLLDGGYVNNLPADVMHNLGAKFVFAVDVGSQDEKDLTNYGDCLSGWWLLWKRWNPWAKPVRVPDMTEIQSRLAYVSCVRQLEVVKNSDYCEYIRPPIDRYATLQFGSFDEIVETGYHHGKTLFSAWSKGGLQDKLFKESESMTSQSHKERNLPISHVPVMAYFTDLAEQVSKIENPRSRFYLSADSEDEVIYEDEDEEAGNMEGYEEDDEFAHSDGDDVSDDVEEASDQRKVTSIISPLYKLGVISKSSLIKLGRRKWGSCVSDYGEPSHTREPNKNQGSYLVLEHHGVSPNKQVRDGMQFVDMSRKSRTIKPSLTKEQFEALARYEFYQAGDIRTRAQENLDKAHAGNSPEMEDFPGDIHKGPGVCLSMNSVTRGYGKDRSVLVGHDNHQRLEMKKLTQSSMDSFNVSTCPVQVTGASHERGVKNNKGCTCSEQKEWATDHVLTRPSHSQDKIKVKKCEHKAGTFYKGDNKLRKKLGKTNALGHLMFSDLPGITKELRACKNSNRYSAMEQEESVNEDGCTTPPLAADTKLTLSISSDSCTSFYVCGGSSSLGSLLKGINSEFISGNTELVNLASSATEMGISQSLSEDTSVDRPFMKNEESQTDQGHCQALQDCLSVDVRRIILVLEQTIKDGRFKLGWRHSLSLETVEERLTTSAQTCVGGNVYCVGAQQWATRGRQLIISSANLVTKDNEQEISTMNHVLSDSEVGVSLANYLLCGNKLKFSLPNHAPKESELQILIANHAVIDRELIVASAHYILKDGELKISSADRAVKDSLYQISSPKHMVGESQPKVSSVIYEKKKITSSSQNWGETSTHLSNSHLKDSGCKCGSACSITPGVQHSGAEVQDSGAGVQYTAGEVQHIAPEDEASCSSLDVSIVSRPGMYETSEGIYITYDYEGGYITCDASVMIKGSSVIQKVSRDMIEPWIQGPNAEPTVVNKEPRVLNKEPSLVMTEPKVVIAEPSNVIPESSLSVAEQSIVMEEPSVLNKEPRVLMTETSDQVRSIMRKRPRVITYEPNAVLAEPSDKYAKMSEHLCREGMAQVCYNESTERKAKKFSPSKELDKADPAHPSLRTTLKNKKVTMDHSSKNKMLRHKNMGKVGTSRKNLLSEKKLKRDQPNLHNLMSFQLCRPSMISSSFCSSGYRSSSDLSIKGKKEHVFKELRKFHKNLNFFDVLKNCSSAAEDMRNHSSRSLFPSCSTSNLKNSPVMKCSISIKKDAEDFCQLKKVGSSSNLVFAESLDEHMPNETTINHLKKPLGKMMKRCHSAEKAAHLQNKITKFIERMELAEHSQQTKEKRVTRTDKNFSYPRVDYFSTVVTTSKEPSPLKLNVSLGEAKDGAYVEDPNRQIEQGCSSLSPGSVALLYKHSLQSEICKSMLTFGNRNWMGSNKIMNVKIRSRSCIPWPTQGTGNTPNIRGRKSHLNEKRSKCLLKGLPRGHSPGNEGQN